ncbi:MAG: BamA/TamA family outer membrane protein [Paludibacteraceae bacterium]|nr:BamA/TamA family outer membrane protein [Paludibacteraceae bacterium]
MKMVNSRVIGCVFAVLLTLSACRTTKYVPEGEYLLRDVEIESLDGKVYPGQFGNLLRQKPASRLGLRIYSLSGRDSTKWMNRLLRKIGSAPVIYAEDLTLKTETQMRKELNNLGYLNAQVGHCLTKKGKKAYLTYCLKENTQYTIRNSENAIDSSELRNIVDYKIVHRWLEFAKDEPFVAAKLDESTAGIISHVRNQGYYNISKDNLYFLVDTTVGNHQVDVALKYRPTKTIDSLTGVDPSLVRYRVKNVIVNNSYSRGVDTLDYKRIKVVRGEETFIRPSIIYYNNFIRSGRYYSDLLLEKTHSSLNSLSAVEQVNISFTPVQGDSALLDAHVNLSPANIYYFQFGIDGTNNAGDLGVASYISFSNKNIFKGSETFRIKLNGAYEHISSREEGVQLLSNNFYEYGVEASISYPRIIFGLLPERYRKQVGSSTNFSASINWQNRPEYNRRFVGLDWGYGWKSHRQRMSHTFDLYNINYVITRDMSDWFAAYLERGKNALLKESYMDQFITRTSYSFSYSSHRKGSSSGNGYTLRGGIDMAGTLPFAVCALTGVDKKPVEGSDEGGNSKYMIFDTPFAQYVKTTFDVSKVFLTKRNNQVVLHADFGFACPYLNSDILPYEQRFFAGGANTVRGWSTRTLGPGRYNSGVKSDFLQRTGDVKLVFNIEHRLKLSSFLELASFLDAGNIWTVMAYKNQPYGQFNIADFYKELGLSWGMGIRPNLSFLVLRFDAGMQLYNPENPTEENAGKSKWVVTHPKFKENFALHFAVGYPF